MLPRILVIREPDLLDDTFAKVVDTPTASRRMIVGGVVATLGLGMSMGHAVAAGRQAKTHTAAHGAHKAAAHKVAAHKAAAHKPTHGALHGAPKHGKHALGRVGQHSAHRAVRPGHHLSRHATNHHAAPEVIRPVPRTFSHFIRTPVNTEENERRLSLYVPNTGETISSVYWAEGEYIPAGLREISYLLRDHRTDTAVGIAPGLLDYLHRVKGQLEYQRPIEVISGYRSPRTNEMLRNHQDGVAKNSYHTKGRAVDIVMPGVDLRNIRNAALGLNAGGVGYYPESRFVHLDCGPRRTWTG